MKYYHISIDFGSDLDLKGKIAASLLIRKMIEYLGNHYESKVESLQDTHCEVALKDVSSQDISDSLRSSLLEITGEAKCQIQISCESRTPSGGSSPDGAGGSGSLEDSFRQAFGQQGGPSSGDSAPKKEPSVLEEIRNLVGAGEFKALAEELVGMSSALRVLKSRSYLQRNTYLFSIDDGYGLTTALRLFAKLLYENKLLSSKEFTEIRIPNLEDDDDVHKLGNNLRGDLPKLEGSVVCLDLTLCQSNLGKPSYRDLLRIISSSSHSVLVFRVPFLERKAQQNIIDVLDDVFFLRPVTFIPMDFEDLSVCATRAAKEYGFTLDPSAEPILA